ncbi:MAG: fructosamine kinase family protein [Chloroflexota bacterium]
MTEPADYPAPTKITDDSLRIPLEQFISEYLGRPWAVKTSTDLRELACHPAAILSDDSYSIFAKFSDAANGREQFEIELASLRLLARHSGVLVPTPIGIISANVGSILILEEVRVVERTPRHWRQIGQALARLHQVKSDQFGLETNGYFGPLRQDNTPMSDWPAFFTERRLVPGLKRAVDSGNLPSPLARQLEQVISRLPELCGPEIVPNLLHGDAQQNNFISAESGVYVIDPAVYYGHPEVDLAYIDYIQPVPDEVFEGYREELPIDPGFWERRYLWRIWGYLAGVTVEGAGYLGQLADAVQRYI